MAILITPEALIDITSITTATPLGVALAPASSRAITLAAAMSRLICVARFPKS